MTRHIYGVGTQVAMAAGGNGLQGPTVRLFLFWSEALFLMGGWSRVQGYLAHETSTPP